MLRQILASVSPKALGVLFQIATVFDVLGFGTARDVALGGVFVTWIVWDVWLAMLVWGRRSPFGDLTRPAPQRSS
jgi:hypothetical protein